MAPAAPDRRADRALGLVVLALVAVAAVRGVGHRGGTRPTDHFPAGTVDLNTADRAELTAVPGIGDGLADAILTHRTAHKFAAVEDLDDVKGVGPATLDELKPWLRVETLERKPPSPAPSAGGKLKPGDPPVDVNTAPEAELLRLPGVGPVLAGRIVLARGAERFRTPDDLRRVKGIGPKTLDGLRPFLVCLSPPPPAAGP
jgi:competence protein ComEA